MAKVIGQSIRRVEDPRFLRGRGRYVADIRIPGTLDAALARSIHPHARITGVATEAALAVTGVVAVWSGKDFLHAGAIEAARRAATAFPLIAHETAHYLGEPVAIVVADSRYAAEDGCDRVEVNYEPLPAVASIDAALAPDAPKALADSPSNLAVEKVIAYGDVEAAFKEAEVRLEEEFYIARASAHALEPRGILAAPDVATGGVTVWAATQTPHWLRRFLSLFLGLPERMVRVIAPDVGGAFGTKAGNYPEDFLVPYLALKLNRPIRWLEDRHEHFVATLHGREQKHKIKIAAKRDGTLLAVDDTVWMDMGAYAAWPHVMENTARTMLGPYRLPHFKCAMRGVLTNKTPIGPYRGAGRPQGNYVMERMMDRLAETVGVDPAEVRRRNFIRAQEMPYTTPIGRVYDSGDYLEALDKTLELLGYERRREQQAQARTEGKYLGIGLAAYIEDTGGAGPYEGAAARLEMDGTVTIYSGSPSSGQSHETTFAQVAAERLSIPMDRIRIIATDTAHPSLGLGAFGSRSAGIATGAIWEACGKLAERLKELAATLLEASPQDLELAEGVVQVKGTPAKTVSFEKLGQLGNAVSLAPLPPGVLPGVEESAYRPSRPQYGNGTHAAVVEVDPDTGQVKLLAYAVVHDCGTLLNPTVVTGQIHGGVLHGIGTALFEELRYDEAGQLQNASYMDYLLPTASDLPEIVVEHVEHPSPFTPTGAKGAGEGGTIPALACVANAVEDALRPLAVRIRNLPITPDRLWEEMNKVKRLK
jgi:carbon-monoxide dehydrogenase large subunit